MKTRFTSLVASVLVLNASLALAQSQNNIEADLAFAIDDVAQTNNEKKPVSPEQTLCRHMTSAVKNTADMNMFMGHVGVTIIDEVACYQQVDEVDTEYQKFCLFRHQYQQRYMIKGAAGAEFYDALVEYFGKALPKNKSHTTQRHDCHRRKSLRSSIT